MGTFEALIIIDKMLNKTNKACNKLDGYYIIYGLPIDKNWH